MKQREADPWEGVEAKYPVQTRFTGRVSNITDYGAFVELEPGIEGLVHVSEMSWTKKNIHPGKIISTSQEVEVMVLDVDPNKRRISLGLKQCDENPWADFGSKHPVGAEIEGQVKNITEFGLFVGLPGGIDGMVHLSDIDWSKSGEEALKKYSKGDTVKVKVLDIDVVKERVSLGIKQLTEDPFQVGARALKKGATVTCTVARVQDNGIEVTVSSGLTGFIRRGDLSRERSEQRPDRFARGDRVDARITNIDRKEHRLTLSIKAHEVAEEKQAMAEYGSSDSGASLGEILGAALRRAGGGGADAAETEGEASAPPAPDATSEDATSDDATSDDAETETAKPEDQDAVAAPETTTADAKAEIEDAGEEAKTAPKKSARKSPAKKPAAKKPAAKKSPARKPAAKKAAAKKNDGKAPDDAKKGASKAKAKKAAKDEAGS